MVIRRKGVLPMKTSSWQARDRVKGELSGAAGREAKPNALEAVADGSSLRNETARG